MKKHILIAIAISSILSVAAVGFVTVRSSGVLQPQQRIDPRKETLRSKAEKYGSATATAQPSNLRRYDTVAALARESKAIIKGKIDSRASQFHGPTEKFIVTDFQITVQDVMKGELQAGQTIKVRTPGGRVELGEGKYAEVKMPDFWKYPEVGEVYLLFLESRADGSFVLRGGPQGLFQVTSAGSLKPQVRPEDKLMQDYDGKSVQSVLKEIREIREVTPGG